MTDTQISIDRCDVLIVGGGMIGLSLALALDGAGLRVVVIDQAAPHTVIAAAHDGRTVAIAAGSRRILDAVGLWPRLAGDAGPIHDIRVTDGASPLFLHYDHRDAGDEPLGWIVENRLIRQALFDAVAASGVTLHAPATVSRLERGPHAVTATLADGTTIRAPLAVAADGRHSATRTDAGIRTLGWRYGQTAIVGTVAHERPHRNVAHERFLPVGPFAILPMTDAPDGTHRSSIVWSEHEDMVAHILALDPADFAAELERRFGTFLGALSWQGQRWSHPLGLSIASTPVADRLALVGDAAAAIHPIAGQGLNLGLRGVATLAEVLVDRFRLGLDLGAADGLNDYAQRRIADVAALVAATDGLNRLFGMELAAVRLARDLGLAAVNRMPKLKRFFMHRAMGVGGTLPRLARGDSL